MMLVAYAVEGRKTIQSTSLDTILTFVAAALLIAAGGNFHWNWGDQTKAGANYSYELNIIGFSII